MTLFRFFIVKFIYIYILQRFDSENSCSTKIVTKYCSWIRQGNQVCYRIIISKYRFKLLSRNHQIRICIYASIKYSFSWSKRAQTHYDCMHKTIKEFLRVPYDSCGCSFRTRLSDYCFVVECKTFQCNFPKSTCKNLYPNSQKRRQAS